MRGLVLTPALEQLVTLLWHVRVATLDQLSRGVFPHVATGDTWRSSYPQRVCQKLVAHGLLATAPLWVERSTAGRCPYLYCLAPAAAPLVSRLVQKPQPAVLSRITQDAKLSMLMHRHRNANTEVFIALFHASHARGDALTWHADEELAGRKLSAAVAGKARPVRPDAFVVLEGKHTTPRFIEIQITSEPRAYRLKAQAYAAFWASGRYEQVFGYRAMRVLALTDSDLRAQHLKQAVEHPSIAEPRLFGATTIARFCADPFGEIFLVGGKEGRAALL